MGFNMLFYIIFRTNLLTEGPVQIAVVLSILVFCKKGIANRIQMEWNLRNDVFWNKRNPEDLELKSGTPRGSDEAGERAQGSRHAPTLMGPTELHRRTSFAYIYSYTLKISGGATKPLFHRRNLVYSRDPILGPFPAICRRENLSWTASTSTPLPLQWSVSSLPQTYGSIASS